jgi:cysteine desulfurase
MNKPIYLDYNATTPLHPEVISSMKPFFEEFFGNPSSSYTYGTMAKAAIEEARSKVASLLGCKAHEIIFTSGGTESNNLAIKGVAFARQSKGKHIITSSIEHPAVMEVCKYLEELGFKITYLPVDRYGLVSPEQLESAITSETILISVMHSNNEIGTLQPIKELAAIARNHGILIHTDAAQSSGKVSLIGSGVDLLSIAGHKLYAPKGIGALYIKEGVRIEKLIHGADHEQNLRAGTENVPSIVSLGKACEVAIRDLEKNTFHMIKLRDLLYDKITEKIPGVILNGHPDLRLPNTLSLSFRNVDANLVLSEIQNDVAASAGAACHTGGSSISSTLKAIQLSSDQAAGTIRFSTGRFLRTEDVEQAAEVIINAIVKLKGNDLPEKTAEKIRLTHFTQGLGCACKMRPQMLEEMMKSFQVKGHPDILVGTETFDDAAVYRLNDEIAIVQTVDFFTPVVDDPYDFGAVAAANALSDIYAMGASPLFALNIVGFPSGRLPMDILKQILQGASDKADEAGIQVIGGHTIEDIEPKFGMAVTGIVNPAKILKNSTARPGDSLIITKPIGTGILSAAMKKGLLNSEAVRVTVATMAELNRKSAEIMLSFPVSACTDITGFGLLGHLKEMTAGSGVEANLHASHVPLLLNVEQLAAAGIVPGGTRNNMEYLSQYVTWDENISEVMKIILCDAQTSGGLLISIPEKSAHELLRKLKAVAISASVIGRISGTGTGHIFVK